jgi:hypothetical protein
MSGLPIEPTLPFLSLHGSTIHVVTHISCLGVLFSLLQYQSPSCNSTIVFSKICATKSGPHHLCLRLLMGLSARSVATSVSSSAQPPKENWTMPRLSVAYKWSLESLNWHTTPSKIWPLPHSSPITRTNDGPIINTIALFIASWVFSYPQPPLHCALTAFSVSFTLLNI